MYIPKRTPREKQRGALDASEGQSVFAYRMAPRVGKTKVTADDFGRLRGAGKVQDLIIIAPGGVYKTWLKTERDGTPIGGALLDDWPDELVNLSAFHVWESGTYSSTYRKTILKRFLDHHTGPRVLVMNIEAISMVEKARELLIKFCAGRRVYCAVDESTIIKNPKSECAKFVVKTLAPLTHYRRILTGLISPKSPLDLYAQFAFLDKKILGHSTYKSFEARYAITQLMEHGGRRFRVVVGHQHTEELYDKIAPYSYRVTLADCYDLPPSTYSIREVAMTEKQEQIYKELKRYSTAKLTEEAHVTATIVIAQITRLHQVLCGHTTDEEGNEHIIPENRTKELLALLEEYEGKAIIWCNYDADIRKVADALTKAYGEGSVARFWGGNNSTREQEESVFKTDPACRFMVATSSAGKFGRTWDMADLVVFYSCTNNLEHRAQAEERPKAVGKMTPIQYVDLQVPNTVEAKIVHAMRNKWDLATIIDGDNYKEWLV